jgi:hypothetical protein
MLRASLFLYETLNTSPVSLLQKFLSQNIAMQTIDQPNRTRPSHLDVNYRTLMLFRLMSMIVVKAGRLVVPAGRIDVFGIIARKLYPSLVGHPTYGLRQDGAQLATG